MEMEKFFCFKNRTNTASHVKVFKIETIVHGLKIVARTLL